jgi:hypothetical protein
MVASTLPPRQMSRLSLWLSLLVGFLLVKVFLSFVLGLGNKLALYGSTAYFLLLLLATGFAIMNAVERAQGRRLFWAFIAAGYALWSLDQWLYLYYGAVRHTEVPDNSIADPALFLHLVPLMAAIAIQPHLMRYDRKSYRATLNFLFVLVFWAFLYAYFVFPYQYLFWNPAIYNSRFTRLYAVENAAIVLILSKVTYRAQAPWRSIYYHLLGASTLYALSSTLANLAIDAGKPYNGSLYSLAQNAAVCWFVWVPLHTRQPTAARIWMREFDARR